jgi:hypothetical protein
MRTFKKTLKITLIVLLSLVVLIAAVAGTATYMVFTPTRLTPIVLKQAGKFVNAKVNMESVELTFFSTFPEFGLKLNRVSVVNEQSGAHRGKENFACGSLQSDSLLTLDALVFTIDVKAYLDHKDVVVKGIELINPNIFAYIDTAGRANFDIVPPSSNTATATDTAVVLRKAMLSFLKIKNANLYFHDEKQRMVGSLCGLNFNVDGQYADNIGSGNVDMSAAQISFAMNDTLLAKNISAALQTSLSFDQNTSLLQLQKADVKLNDITFSTSGSVQTDTAFSQFDTDLQLALKIPSLTNLLNLVPIAMVPEAAQAKVYGGVEFSGSAKGLFKNSTSMPVVNGELQLKNIGGAYQAIPYKLDKMNSLIGLLIDLNRQENSFAEIKRLDVEAMDSKLSVAGVVSDVMGDPLLRLSVKASTDLAKLTTKHIPLKGMQVEGLLKADVKTNMRLSEATDESFEKLKVSGSVDIAKLKYSSEKDSTSASLGDIRLDFETNKRSAAKRGKDFLAGQLVFNAARAQMGENMRANLRSGSLAFTTSNLTDTTKLPTLHCNFNFGGAFVRIDDSIKKRVSLRQLRGVTHVKPTKENPLLPQVETSLELDSLRARVDHNFVTLLNGKNKITAEQSSDTTVGFQGWKAMVDMDYTLLQAFTPTFPERVFVDKIVAQITDEKQELKQLDVRVGNSDMQLTGTVENALAYLNKKATVKTNIKLAANSLDLNQLMRIAEAGSKVEVSDDLDVENPEHVEAIKQAAQIDTTPPELKAFLLPTDIFANFETDIKQARFGKMELENVNGAISFADGALMLQELGVVANKKSRMKLNAIYRTPERNHIFAGMQFHLMDVELGDLQEMIPDVDSVLPMLRSFEGKVDFHLAAQTYLDSGYNVKYSTLRATSSIHGERLVLMDNSTFEQISKLLRYKNKERNVIDSVDVEVIVYKKQIELYPFLLHMDRYKIAMGGVHKLDMNMSYHVSVLESPLPRQLGVDIKGNMNDIAANPMKHIKLVKPRYATTFTPEKRGATKTAEEEIRDQIRAALRKAAEN